MKLTITGQEKGDLLIQGIAGLTVFTFSLFMVEIASSI